MAYPTLRAEMARRGITQSRLAKKLGLSQNYFNQKMTGKRHLRLDEATIIADEIGCSLDYLFGKDIPRPDQPE